MNMQDIFYMKNVLLQVLKCGKYKDVTECGVSPLYYYFVDLLILQLQFVNCTALLYYWMWCYYIIQHSTGWLKILKWLSVPVLCVLKVDLNSRNTVTSERQNFYCVPVPGESQWAKDISFRFDVIKTFPKLFVYFTGDWLFGTNC